MPQDVNALVDEMRQIATAGGGSPIKVRVEELAERVRNFGGQMIEAPVTDIRKKLAMLSEADRGYVMRQLAAGQPAVVYRDAKPGEPRGKVAMAFMLVQMPVAPSAPAPQRAAPPPPQGPAPGTVDSILARERARAGLKFSRFHTGANNQTAFRSLTSQQLDEAHTSRQSVNAFQQERVAASQVVGMNPHLTRMGTQLRPAGMTRLAQRQMQDASFFTYNQADQQGF